MTLFTELSLKTGNKSCPQVQGASSFGGGPALGQVKHGHRLHPMTVPQGNEVAQNGAQIFYIGLGRAPKIMRVPPEVIVLSLPGSLGHLTFYPVPLRPGQQGGRRTQGAQEP